MAKVISQETFDDVVKENMEDFDMGVDEAIADAVTQFESQGVNLLNIIKDPGMFTNGTGQTNHAVIQALEKVKTCVETNLAENLLDSLAILQTECDEDLARRCLAGKNDGYKILMKALNVFKSDSALMEIILTTFCSLVNGQPDLLDEEGVTFLLNYLTECSPREKPLVVKLIRLFCIKHEKNRQIFVLNNVIGTLSVLLANHKTEPELVQEICICLRVLTFDDDVRVPFGKAHEHAKMIVTEGDALKRILEICQDYSEDSTVLGEMWSTLACLVVRDEFCKEVLEMGGLALIIKSFEKNINDKNITRKSLTVMKALAGNDNVKIAIVKSGGIELIVAAMLRHQSVASIAEAACATLMTVALRNPSNSQKIMECNGHQAIVQCMKIHSSVLGVQKQGCMALRNIVSRTREHCDSIVELGVEEVINKARKQFKDLDDEAKAALRDLGCKVDLKEQWKGERGSIVH
ncbi:armadillo repeat-containing protein 6 [Patella vulgata]|uniref:armadillo repeat-containing protein 6 n=1 Tax=Patella vulgata TaxID=6465 RepID=UPI0021805F30|nr:armadillo repeat-containing protein 6 [Patella vulgata]